MKLQLNCGACMINQALTAMDHHRICQENQLKIVKNLLADMPTLLSEPTPSHFQSILLAKLAEYMAVEDIYSEDKKQQNNLALELLPNIQEQIGASADPLYTSALFAVNGNLIDLIFTTNVHLKGMLHRVLGDRFVIDHYSAFFSRLPSANTLVYILDNAGEIVFDRLFIEQFQTWRRIWDYHPIHVTAIVKGSPVLNDATRADAALTGLDPICTILDSGSNYLGLPWERTQADVTSAIEAADLVIAKGQANFETLEEQSVLYGKTFFLLKAKCLHVAAHLGVAVGSSVFYHQ